MAVNCYVTVRSRWSGDRKLRMDILVVDTGTTIVGVYSLGEATYTAYRWGDMALAVPRIEMADEVVTFNGASYDLDELAKLAGRKLRLTGRHTDMLLAWWSLHPTEIFGKGLREIHRKVFGMEPTFKNPSDDSYIFDNQSDVYMTLDLWELWKSGR